MQFSNAMPAWLSGDNVETTFTYADAIAPGRHRLTKGKLNTNGTVYATYLGQILRNLPHCYIDRLSNGHGSVAVGELWEE